MTAKEFQASVKELPLIERLRIDNMYTRLTTEQFVEATEELKHLRDLKLLTDIDLVEFCDMPREMTKSLEQIQQLQFFAINALSDISGPELNQAVMPSLKFRREHLIKYF